MAAHGLLLLGETPERRLFVGVGLEYVQEVGCLHDVVRSLWGAALHPGVDPTPLSDHKIDHDHYDKGRGQWWKVVHSDILLLQLDKCECYRIHCD